jgi:L-lactate utilization protein LutB
MILSAKGKPRPPAGPASLKVRAMDQTIVRTIRSLRRRQIVGWAAVDAAEARDIVLNIIPPEAVVGTGDSTSVRQIGIVESLEARGNRMINGFALPDQVTDLRSL